MNNTPIKPSDLRPRTPDEPADTLSSDHPAITAGLPSSGLDTGATLASQQRIGDFTILRILGEGGMGTVYLAEDVRLGRKAAIKTMKLDLAAKPENRGRFIREARAAAAVEHDNIVPVWQVGEAADGSPFIAMPFLQGEVLEARLKREPIQPLGIILKVAREVAEGLAAAHAQGLIHRDIKPGNVWIEGDPDAKDLAGQVRRCKILDFGLARSLDAEDVQITASGAVLGTPAYMAPEQARGETVDHRADLFSLGVMLYRMSTGRLPFDGPSVMAVLTALATVTPPPSRTRNRNLPQVLSDLIDRLLSKDPAGRPQSAAEVAAAIRQIVKELQARKSAAATVAPVEARVTQDQSTQAAPASAAKVSENTIPVEPKPAPRPHAMAGRGRKPVLVALGLLALVPLGWWLVSTVLRVETANGTLVVEINDAETEARIKNGKLILTGPDDKVRYTLIPSERNSKIEAGPYKIRVEGADGLTLDTPEFTLKKDGKVTVRVTAAARAVAKGIDRHREAAEHVISLGGKVWVNNVPSDIKAVADLPREPFRLTHIDVEANPQTSDEDLGKFTGCESLIGVWLPGTRVGDAGVQCLRACKEMQWLGLQGTRVNGRFLATLKGCRVLRELQLDRTQVEDASLAFIKDFEGLVSLHLEGTQVSDAGLTYLKDCKNLTGLDLRKTKVAAAKIEELKKALPGCKIEWDGGVIEPRASLDPDRKAAEWVLSIGGMVRVYDQERDIKAAGDLPRESFRLTGFVLSENKQVSDAGLAHFKDCKSLVSLVLSSTPVSDAGLAHFKDCKNLDSLWLNNCPNVGDVGLAHFKDCKNLTQLTLAYTQASDVGLANFKDCKNLTGLGLEGTKVSDMGLTYFKDYKNLTGLSLEGTKVSDVGLANFKDCKNLTDLNLSGTQVSDVGLAYFKDCNRLSDLRLWDTQVSGVGLAHFKDCKGLSLLWLSRTKVSDESLAYFKDCKNLTNLSLWGTKVSDAGLVHIKNCKKLTELNLKQTKVTAAKIDELKKALPACRIEWDGGVIEPMATLDPDRKAAEYVLSIGGTVRVNDQDPEIKAAAALPPEAFHLTWVNLHQNKQVSDVGLAHFKDCKNLTGLDLKGTQQVGDMGLANFKDCKNLTYLDLWGTQVSDVGLANFKDCKNPIKLNLGSKQVSDAGLVHFKDCKNLTVLWLGDTQVSDAGLAYFKDCKNLEILGLCSTKVSDAGLANFKDCKNLTNLDLSDTQVSDAGLAYFKDCKNLTQLRLSYTQVSDVGLVHFKDCKNLTFLGLQKTKATAAKVEELKKALPMCKIEWDGM